VKFDQAIRSCFERYATFSGRAPRSEYWYWFLFFWVGWWIILSFTRLYYIWDFGLLIPSIAVGVRRMHDSDHSGWWIIFPIVNLVLLLFPSKDPKRFHS
jgi:uncharacterized membrane protein YhaH (DUF805 family)